MAVSIISWFYYFWSEEYRSLNRGLRHRSYGVSFGHRLPKLKSRLFDCFFGALRAADSTYVVYATACVYREMYGKITDYLKWGK